MRKNARAYRVPPASTAHVRNRTYFVRKRDNLRWWLAASTARGLAKRRRATGLLFHAARNSRTAL